MANKRGTADIAVSTRSERVLNPENTKTVERPGLSAGTTERQYHAADTPPEPAKVEIERDGAGKGTKEVLRVHPENPLAKKA